MKNSFKIDAEACRPDSPIISRAADVLRRGGAIVFPTRSLYAAGVDAKNPEAVARIFEIKGRPAEKPLPVMVADEGGVRDAAAKIPETAGLLMENFWPGRLTLIFEASPDLPEILTANTGKIGVRIPGHPVAKALLQAFASPVTCTSANASGDAGYASLKDMPENFARRFDMLVDSGGLNGPPVSTVADVTENPPVILREGAIAASEILKFSNYS